MGLDRPDQERPCASLCCWAIALVVLDAMQASTRPIASRVRRRAPMSLSSCVDLVFSAWSHQEPPQPFIFNAEACLVFRPSVPHRPGRYVEDFGAWTARNRRRSPICCQALRPIAASLCPDGLWRHAIGRWHPRPRFHAHAAQLQQQRSATDLPKASGDPGLDDLPVHGHRTASDRPQLTAAQARTTSFLCSAHLAVGRAEWVARRPKAFQVLLVAAAADHSRCSIRRPSWPK